MNRKVNPRRKRLKPKARLLQAKKWVHTYTGKNIIKAYAKWFGVDWICALSELKLVGVLISDEAEQKIVSGYSQRIQQRKSRKELRAAKLAATNRIDEEAIAFGFDIVIGYTSGGLPYGIKSEEDVFIRNPESL